MRVIAGKYAGQQIKAPKGHRTHPMSEKIRGAIFSALGDIEGLSVFDAYGGSGAIGIEAASRGASVVTITEIDKKAYEVIKENIELVGAEEASASRANCVSWLETNSDIHFDVIIADPPYDDIKPAQLDALAERLKKSGVFVLSHGEEQLKVSNLTEVKFKNYGDANLTFYKF